MVYVVTRAGKYVYMHAGMVKHNVCWYFNVELFVCMSDMNDTTRGQLNYMIIVLLYFILSYYMTCVI